MQAANDALQVYQKPEPVQGNALCTICPIHAVTACRKVAILFKAIGNAPIMKQNLYKINAQNQFRAVIRFLRKQLGYNPQDALVCPQVVLRPFYSGLPYLIVFWSLHISTFPSHLRPTIPC